MFARLAVICNPRRLPRARCKMLIPQTAFTAARDLHAFARMRKIVQKRFGFPLERAKDEGTDRHRNREIRAAAPGFVRLTAGFARVSCELALITKLDQR
jgi:hypothetical protein